MKCWLSKVVGDKSEYLHPVTGKLVNGAIFHLRSTIWPGFHLFYKDGEFFKMYFGNGEKYDPRPYFPKLSVNIAEDAPDPVPTCEYEPVPKKAEPETKDADQA